MFEARLGRPRPHLDDKVLTAWNGLMIAAFARMARVLRGLGADGRAAGEPYLEAARRAAAFIRERMWNAASGTLLRRYRDGHAEIDGYAEDYAYLIFGLLELFQADADPAWLEWAIALQRRQDELFWDEADGGWFSTTGRDPSVLLRMKEDYDGAEPTASSVSVLNLLVLSHLVRRAAVDRSHRADAAAVRHAARADGPRRADDGGGAVHLHRRPPADRHRRRRAGDDCARCARAVALQLPAVCDSAARHAASGSARSPAACRSSRRCSRSTARPPPTSAATSPAASR